MRQLECIGLCVVCFFGTEPLTEVFSERWGPSSFPSSLPWEGRSSSSPCHNELCLPWPFPRTSLFPCWTWSADTRGREGREPGSDPAPARPFPPGGAAAAGAALTFHRSEHLRENSAKLTDESGCFFLCSSRHVCTK